MSQKRIAQIANNHCLGRSFEKFFLLDSQKQFSNKTEDEIKYLSVEFHL